MRRPLLLLLVLLVPALAAAQGLGDLAARERQKRAVPGKEKARVLTNDDLPKAPPGTSSAAGAEAPAPASEATPLSPSGMNEDEETPADDPLARAQAQADAARSAVVAAEERVKSLGDKLNPMSPSFIYGVVQTGDAVGEEIRTREELRQAEGELQAARDNLVQANQAVETARDAARRLPPE